MVRTTKSWWDVWGTGREEFTGINPNKLKEGIEWAKGDVIDKSSDITRMAVLNGILGGIASFFQNQATSGIYPVSPITGQTNALTGKAALKAGSASGVGNALQKLADYAIKRAEQMSPVIVIGSGRVIDVVLLGVTGVITFIFQYDIFVGYLWCVLY